MSKKNILEHDWSLTVGTSLHISEEAYFYSKYKTMPSRISIIGKFKHALIFEKFGQPDISEYTFDPSEKEDEGKEFHSRYFIDYVEGVVVYYEASPYAEHKIHILFLQGKKAIAEICAKVIVDFYVKLEKVEEDENPLNMLAQDSKGRLYLHEFQIKKPVLDLDTNYNDGFVDIHNLIVEKFSAKNEKGIVLLHGKPGTGKTNYIKYLLSVMKKKVIYIPPMMAEQIASPQFINFMSGHPNCILVIEDAETILTKRARNYTQATANLLNIGDGLLGESLHLQVLCTFNMDHHEIDEALLRKGRLIARWEFDKLSPNKSQALGNKLGKKLPEVHGEMTLADIYNLDDKDFGNQPERRKIGFGNG